MCYLLVLIGCDGGEHGLREGEGAGALPGRDSSHRGQLLSTLLPDDVDPRLVLVHGVQNDLRRVGQTCMFFFKRVKIQSTSKQVPKKTTKKIIYDMSTALHKM